MYDGQVSPGLESHKGKLWECSRCGLAWNNQKAMHKNKSACKHKLLFSDLQPKSWGHTTDRGQKVTGLPDGHYNLGEDQPPQQVVQQQGGSLQQPAPR